MEHIRDRYQNIRDINNSQKHLIKKSMQKIWYEVCIVLINFGFLPEEADEINLLDK